MLFSFLYFIGNVSIVYISVHYVPSVAKQCTMYLIYNIIKVGACSVTFPYPEGIILPYQFFLIILKR